MDAADGLDLYGRMCFLRHFEERADALYRQGLIHGPVHLGLGQEAVAVGAAAVLRPGDYSLGTYRGHAHALARGAPPDAVLAELLGRAGGICGGKGGSMHITSVEHGYYGSYAIVGAHLPIACGLAWAARIRRTGAVTVCFFGDGATNIGAFHEAVNLAAVWRLPVVFVCENNWYMEYTPIGEVIPVALPAADRAAAYGLDRIVVDGNDVAAVREVIGAAVSAARGWPGAEPGRGADLPSEGPFGRRRRWLPAGRGGGPVAGAGSAADHPGRAGQGRHRGRCPGRDRRPHPGGPGGPGEAGARPARARPVRRVDRRVERRELAMADLTYRQAVAAALAQEMARDDRVVLLGEDVASGGVFKATTGLLGPVRRGAGLEHAHLRAGHRRRRDGRGHGRAAAGRRDHVRRFLRDLLGSGGQRDRQGPVHDRRPGQHAAGAARGERLRRARASAASTASRWRTGR